MPEFNYNLAYSRFVTKPLFEDKEYTLEDIYGEGFYDRADMAYDSARDHE
jgi:hypothetical protein